MLIVGVVVIALFVWRQLVIDNPMLELHVFKYPVFSLSVILGSIVTMAMIGAEIVLPLYIQTIRGESALQSGLLLLPGAIIMGIMSPITGIIFDKIGAKWLTIYWGYHFDYRYNSIYVLNDGYAALVYCCILCCEVLRDFNGNDASFDCRYECTS